MGDPKLLGECVKTAPQFNWRYRKGSAPPAGNEIVADVPWRYFIEPGPFGPHRKIEHGHRVALTAMETEHTGPNVEECLQARRDTVIAELEVLNAVLGNRVDDDDIPF